MSMQEDLEEEVPKGVKLENEKPEDVTLEVKIKPKSHHEKEVVIINGMSLDYEIPLLEVARNIMFIGVYNHKMSPECDWKDLTSPPHDLNVAMKLAKKLGLKLYAFTNLTGKQIITLSNNINKALQNLPQETVLLFHYSGHGGILLEKLT
eukprot:UN34186